MTDHTVTGVTIVFSIVLLFVVDGLKRFLGTEYVNVFVLFPVVMSFSGGAAVNTLSHTLVALNEDCFPDKGPVVAWYCKKMFRDVVLSTVAGGLGYIVVVYVLKLGHIAAAVMVWSMIASSVIITLLSIMYPFLLRSISHVTPLRSPTLLLITNDVIVTVTFFTIAWCFTTGHR